MPPNCLATLVTLKTARAHATGSRCRIGKAVLGVQKRVLDRDSEKLIQQHFIFNVPACRFYVTKWPMSM